MKDDRAVTVDVSLDTKTFRNFALFDTFRLKKRWIRPAVFCGIMSAFALAALLAGNEQSGLIAGVLFAVGIDLQAKKMHLSAKRKVYTVTVDSSGVTVEHHLQKGETLHMNWSDIAGAYRRRRCIYLYADNNRAFLLPNGQADTDDSELWDRISEHVSDKKRK